MKRKILIPPIFFIVLTFLIPFCYGADEISLYDFPKNLADKLNIDDFSGGILASAIILLTFMLPITLITRSKFSSWIPELIIGFVILGFCVAIGWLPYWFILIITMIVALMFAGTMRDLITGRGK